MDAISGEIRDTGLAEALSERYLAYALSTITARSLPDARDGLKPVHRRLLYAMRQLRLRPGEGYKKSARVVGDTMGKFHPHGDAAIYEAMVRLAQEFAQRWPLVDGQGNFGNIDGDNAAAMRYTEARLTEVAERLLEGIDEDAVDFRDTYDGEGREPAVLPAAFPNLLANGAQGIAVGMATSIPPHNVEELCDALLRLLDDPGAGDDELARLVPGPDFPTGGVLVESRESAAEAYRTGRGGFRLRARWEVEKLGRGAWRIAVTEIPYQVQKSRLVERLAELLEARKLALLGDVRDESAEDVRLVLEPRSRNVDPAVLMESLFQRTDLEVRFPLNLNVLDGERTPGVVPLRGALAAFLDHRMEVLVRRSRHRLARIEERLEVLEGYLVAYLNIDETIRLIREEDDPRAEMMRRWDLSGRQADAILNMRLRALRKLEEIEIRKEHEEAIAEKEDLEALLGDGRRRRRAVAREISELRRAFGKDTAHGRRRTRIGAPPAAAAPPPEALVEREAITVVCSEMGWIRAVRGRVADEAALRFKEGDGPRFLLPAETGDRVLVFATNGRFYTIPADRLPRGRGHGEPLRLAIDLPDEHDAVAILVWRPEGRVLLASDDGRGFVAETRDLAAQTRAGRQTMTPAPGARAAFCVPADGDTVAVVGENRKLLVFPLDEVPEMARGKGAILQRHRTGKLADARVFRRADGLDWRLAGGRRRVETDLAPWTGRRGSAGRAPPTGFPRPPRFT